LEGQRQTVKRRGGDRRDVEGEETDMGGRRGGDRQEGGGMETDGARGQFHGHCLSNRRKKEDKRHKKEKKGWLMTIIYTKNDFIFLKEKSACQNFFSSGINIYEYNSPPVLKLIVR
jgi:hypothetical protein